MATFHLDMDGEVVTYGVSGGIDERVGYSSCVCVCVWILVKCILYFI